VIGLGSRLAHHLGTFRQVFGNPHLRRLELAWGGYYLGEWMQFVALSIYAFKIGGATALGVLGLARMVPAALLLPFGSMLADRYPRQRVLLGVNLARAAALGATGAALAGGSPRALVFVLAGCAAVPAAPIRPATMALVPLIAQTPQELVGANVCSSSLEGLGTFLGPTIGGALAATAGPDVGVFVAGAIYLWCAFLVGRIRREGDPAVRRRVERGPLEEVLGGFRAVAHDPHPRLITALFASQSLVRGFLNVLLVVAAIDFLGMGESGVGWLNGALGGGAVLGGIAMVALVGRRRLASPFGLALVLWGAPIALVAAWPKPAWALFCLAVIGVGNALIDVTGYTLFQRTVDEHVLGRVLGLSEILAAGDVAIGSALGSLLVTQVGIRPALVVVGCILPTLALLSYRGLRAIDGSVEVPERELSLLAAMRLFAPLPITTLERLASRLREVKSPAGETIVEQGAAGDLFYAISSGEVDVEHDGRRVATLGPGDYFGEIALLYDEPRVASCIARTDVDLFALDRPTFIAAVSGHSVSIEVAEDVMTKRLADLGSDPGSTLAGADRGP
jgi:MFS family permease